MKFDVTVLFILLLFLALSLLVTLKAFTTDGYFTFRDTLPVFDSYYIKEYFFHLYKSTSTNLDEHKRIVERWIYFFLDPVTIDQIKLPIVAFLTLSTSFYVFNEILKKEKLQRKQRIIIAAAVAFTYLINPLNTQIFLLYFTALSYLPFPVFFYFLYTGFKETNLRFIFLSSLIAAFMFLMVVHTALHLAISVFVVLLINLRKPPAMLFRNLILFSLVFLFSTSFILLPSFFLSLTDDVISEDLQSGLFKMSGYMLDVFSSSSDLSFLFLGDFHVFWWPYIDYDYPFGNLFYLLSFIFASILIFHAIFDKNDWSVMAIIALVIVFFFSKGNNPPFPWIYEWINLDMPYIGWLLRVPRKFVHLIPFFFSILFLRFSVFVTHKNKNLSYAFCAIYLAFLAIFSWPFFTGDMDNHLHKVELGPEMVSLNEALPNDYSNLLLFHGKSYDFNNKLFYVYHDVLGSGPFLSSEYPLYSNFKNWSSMYIAKYIGAQYLIAGSVEKNGLPFPQIYEGPKYSIYKLKEDPSILHVAESSSLYYGNLNTARSIIRDTPEEEMLEVVFFPYQRPDFPEEDVDSAQYIVLDSAPLEFSKVDSERLISFSGKTPFWSGQGVKTLRNWDLSGGFKAIERTPSKEYLNSSELVLSLEDLQFEHDDLLTKNNTSFIVHSSEADLWPIASSGIDIEDSEFYELHMVIEGHDLEGFISALIMRENHGKVVKEIYLGEATGSSEKEINKTFFVPSSVTNITMVLSSKTSHDEISGYAIKDFELRHNIYALKGDSIRSSFNIPSEGDFDIYLRVLRSPQGGGLRPSLDGKQLNDIITEHGQTYFHWEKIYSGELAQGEHNLSVEQRGGHNTLNVAYYAKPESHDFSNKTIVYRLTGLNDFYGDGALHIQNSTASTFYYLYSSTSMYSDIEVPVNGQYNLSYRFQGSADICVDGSKIDDSIYLSKGTHTIEVRPLNSDVIYLDHVTLIKYGKPKKYEVELLDYKRLDPSKYSIIVNSTTPFYITFGENYNTNWVATVNGKEYRPVASYASVNSYYIHETGLNEVIIEYQPQRWFYAGVLVGILGLIVTWSYIGRVEQ